MPRLCTSFHIDPSDPLVAEPEVLARLTKIASNLGVLGGSRRWMGSHDVGKIMIAYRWGLRFLVEISLVLQHSNPFIGATSSGPSLKDIKERYNGGLHHK